MYFQIITWTYSSFICKLLYFAVYNVQKNVGVCYTQQKKVHLIFLWL